MDFKALALLVARNAPTLALAEVLDLTDALLPFVDEKPLVLADPESLGTHALGLPDVVYAATCDRKIMAIKELRAATNCGLKEAKDAIESKAFTARHPNMVSRAYNY